MQNPKHQLPLLRKLLILCTAGLIFQTAHAEPSDKTTVYHVAGKNRVHVEECKRLTKDPAELAKLAKMTLAEAKAKGLPLCSKCPGSTTEGKGDPKGEPSEPNGDTKVYWDGGKRGHVDGCTRLPKDPAELAKLKTTTYAEMKSGGALLCSRCPGSTTPGKGNPGGGKDLPAPRTPGPGAVEYDPNTKVHVDALWFRVHAEDCPELILKGEKKTMTLGEADKAGARIGESGQSGRENCCLQGYQRKFPKKEIPDDFLGTNQVMKDGSLKWHLSGCHRFVPKSNYARLTKKEAIEAGSRICDHCVERGPSLTTISDEGWAMLPSESTFVPPEGWEPKPFSTENLPPKEEVEILIQETLARSNGIQDRQFKDPVATVENFMTMRFFFPVENWLHFYKAYRSTGDKRLLGKLLESARHYNKLAQEYPSAAQLKASDPEGMPFMYSMAAAARITLQLARNQSSAVSDKDIEEAEAFLKTMLSVLNPTCEGDQSLDPDMGIPRKLADDFRTRAFNRSMNGIGTLAMMTVALEDLQKLKKTKEHQPAIDHYRKVIQEYIKYWFKIGDLVTTPEGEKHFVYPYAPQTNPKIVDGSKIYKRAEDGGHYSHTMQGVMCIYESTPDVGINDDFMTAVANAVYRSSTVKVQVGKKKKLIYSGHIESPTQAKVQPTTKEGGKHHYSAARDRFYMLEAFKDGMIDALCITLNEAKKAEANSEYDKRLATLHAHYMKALRKDRSLIHLSGKKP